MDGVYRMMKYITGTIADVVYDGSTAVLILDVGHSKKHHLQADAQLLTEALTALFGADCVGKPVAVQCDGSMLTSVEIPGVAPNYSI